MVEFKGDASSISQVLKGLHVVDLGPTKIYCNCCVDNVERIEFLNASFVPERTCEISSFDDGLDESYDGSRYSCAPPTYYLSCGHEAYQYKPNYCPSCGEKVVG